MRLSPPRIYSLDCARFFGAILLGWMVMAATSAQAAVLAYEGFDYSTGTLIGQNGGTGFSGGWSQFSGTNAGVGTETVIAGSLGYSNLTTTGNQAVVTPTGNPAPNTVVGAMRSLDSTYSSGTVYLSFLANLDEGQRFFGVSLFGGGTERLLIGKGSGANVWGVSGSGITTAGLSSVNVTLDTTFLFVVRIDFNASSANERIRLYLNPPLGSEPGSAAVNVVTTSSFSLDAIRIGAGYDNGTQTTAQGAFDEIRIGTTWADVTPIPEPGSAGLLISGLILSLAAVAAKRRRWRGLS